MSGDQGISGRWRRTLDDVRGYLFVVRSCYGEPSACTRLIGEIDQMLRDLDKLDATGESGPEPA